MSSTSPHFFRGHSGELLAGENDFEGLGQPDQPRQAHGAAPRRQDADLHFGQADLGGRIVAGHPPVARQRQFRAAADAHALDRRHRRNGQPVDARKRLMAAVDDAAQAFVGHRAAGEPVEVRPGDEDFTLGRAEDDALDRAALGRVFQVVEVRVEFLEGQRVEDVGRRVGPVEGHDANCRRCASRAGCS